MIFLIYKVWGINFFNSWYEASFLRSSQEDPTPEHRRKYLRINSESYFIKDSIFCAMVRFWGFPRVLGISYFGCLFLFFGWWHKFSITYSESSLKDNSEYTLEYFLRCSRAFWEELRKEALYLKFKKRVPLLIYA